MPDGRVTLLHGDCLERMAEIPAESIDMVLCDMPYGGKTECLWDVAIPLTELWQQYRRIVKPAGAIVLTACQPFTSALVMSNLRDFRYAWVWDKIIPSGMSYARFQPMRQHEDILVFCRTRTRYNAQKTKRDKPIKEGGKKPSESAFIRNFASMGGKIYEDKNPTTILRFDKVRRGTIHPTQKPVPLLEYLIQTYTDPDHLVLDNAMGSASTGVACLNTGRRFLGIEKDASFFALASDRLDCCRRGAA
jgi:DNA modification methylase